MYARMWPEGEGPSPLGTIRNKGTERMRELYRGEHPWSSGHGKEGFETLSSEMDQRGRAGCGASRPSGSAGGMGRRSVR